MRRTLGFSLIELTVTIAVIAILTVIAVPSFSGYQTRARATEFIIAANPHKTLLAEWVAVQGVDARFPTSAAQLGWPPLFGEFVSTIEYIRRSDQVADVLVSGNVLGDDITVYHRATIRNGGLTWQCLAPQDSLTFLPKTCQLLN